jgi:hypothetical protein
MQKQTMIIIAAILGILVVVGAGVGIYSLTKKQPADQTTDTTTKKKKKLENYNVIPVEERPYLTIRPSDGGRNIFLSVNEVKKTADSVEFELEYQAGELLQGAFGQLPLTTLPSQKDILLGSCSAGGKCTYHTDVQGGSIITRFAGANEYALKNDWRYIDNKTKDPTAASKDAKFQVESPELAKQKYLIVTNSPGYPGTLPGTPISDIYVLAAPAKITGQLTVTIRGTEDASTAKLAVYDGTSWKTVTGKAEEKSLSATADFADAYVLVK